MTAFSSRQFKQSIVKAMRKKRNQILLPIVQELTKDLETCQNPAILTEKIEKYIAMSNELCCPSKPSYTFETAAERYNTDSMDVEPYLCQKCGFIHFGHTPHILMAFQAKIKELTHTKP